MKKVRKRIIRAFEEHFGETPVKICELKKGVSEKLILRLATERDSVIGVYNRSIPENKAFIAFTNAFSGADLKTPSILHSGADGRIYFVSDVGSRTLYEYIISGPPRATLMNYYKKAVRDLIDFQEFGKDLIDLRHCYETKYFDERQILYDINRFFNYFLKKYLNKNFHYSSDEILEAVMPHISRQESYFMYRDFQPRNIIKNGRELYYLDYQSGRMGPPQYDLVSFLYSGSIDITDRERKNMVQYYLKKAKDRLNFDEKSFTEGFRYFVMLRLLQILGSYCYSGLEKGLTDTLKKIPKAVRNIQKLNFEEKVLNDLKEFIVNSYIIHISERR
ncbi:MAG: phosphotransferase [Bacteroidetes bacterium]|nr:phosphotransferase [Bacteroidota bacterium]